MSQKAILVENVPVGCFYQDATGEIWLASDKGEISWDQMTDLNLTREEFLPVLPKNVLVKRLKVTWNIKEAKNEYTGLETAPQPRTH